MADDLGDEYWLDSGKTGVYGDVEHDVTPDQVKHGQKKGSTKENQQQNKKRKQEPPTEQENREKAKKPKKKRKKKTMKDHLESVGDQPGTEDDLRVSIATHFHDTLSSIEMEELLLDGDCFLAPNRDSVPVSDYLSRTIPRWADMVEEHKTREKTPNQSCIILLLTSSAKRAVDLNRDTLAFKGTCVTAKLFAKHLRISEQEKFLQSHRVQFAVATPHRVASLLDSGSFSVDDMKHVILDWNWRDAKLRRLVDIPELKKDLFDLLRKHLVPAANKGQLSFGLF